MKEYGRRVLRAGEGFDQEGLRLVWEKSDYEKTPVLMNLGCYTGATYLFEITQTTGTIMNLQRALEVLEIDEEVQECILDAFQKFEDRMYGYSDMLPIGEEDKSPLTVDQFLGINASRVQRLDGFTYLESKIIERLFSFPQEG